MAQPRVLVGARTAGLWRTWKPQANKKQVSFPNPETSQNADDARADACIHFSITPLSSSKGRHRSRLRRRFTAQTKGLARKDTFSACSLVLLCRGYNTQPTVVIAQHHMYKGSLNGATLVRRPEDQRQQAIVRH